MKKARFTESQIVAILKEADAGIPVGDVIRKHGISSASYYKWKAKYGGLDASELKRIKELEGQLAEFKQIVADLDLLPRIGHGESRKSGWVEIHKIAWQT